MVHFSVIRVKGSPSYDFDACGDILAMAKAVGVMTENMRTDRCDNTQCDGSRCKGNTMFSVGVRHRKSQSSSQTPCQMKRPRLTPRGETAVQVRADIGSAFSNRSRRRTS